MFSLFAAVFLLPGLVVGRMIGAGRSWILYGLAFTVILAVLSVFVGKVLEVPLQTLPRIWLLVAGASVLLSIVYNRLCAGSVWRHDDIGTSTMLNVAAVVVAVASGLYALWTGPYLEVPSDAIWHLARIRDQYDLIAVNSDLRLLSLSSIFNKHHAYIYHLSAQLAWLSEMPPEVAANGLNVLYLMVLSVAFFIFGAEIFSSITGHEKESIIMALVATGFLYLHFGLGVFAFVRYYTFGPVFLNYVVYFASILALLRYLESPGLINRWLVFLMISMPVMTMVHKQEAMFLMVIAVAMLFVLAYRHVKGRSSHLTRPVVVKQRVMIGLLVIAYLGIHGWLYMNVVRNNPLNHKVLTDIHELLPFLQNLYILKPDYQFFLVVTVWGVFVYLLYGAWYRKQMPNLYISAAMLVPFLTLFNPVFVDLFLRVTYPEVLWRIAYVVPLQLVGAFILVVAIKTVITGRLINRLGSLVVVASLIFFLLPVQNTYYRNDYSKFHLLAAVKPGNDARAWSALLDQLRSMPRSTILTDPITGYTINAHTSHTYPAHKFSGRGMLSMGDRVYEPSDFRRYNKWLLVINQKDGAHSRTGKIGMHWSRNAMRPRLFYKGSLQSFVEANPDMFVPLWQGERQWIYKITF